MNMNTISTAESPNSATLSIQQLVKLAKSTPPAASQFSVKLSGKYLSLFTFLKRRRPSLGVTSIVHDGLMVLGLLHSEDESGQRPTLIVRLTDANGQPQDRPLSDFVALEYLERPEDQKLGS